MVSYPRSWPLRHRHRPITRAKATAMSAPGWATRAPVIAQHGMAATAQPLATQVAIDILKTGRHGGGCGHRGQCRARPDGAGVERHRRRSVRHRLGSEDAQAVRLQLLGPLADGPVLRSRCCAKLHGAHHICKWGSLPVTVPGTVDGWGALHAAFRQAPLAQDLAPAIAYARDGFPVTQLIALVLAAQHGGVRACAARA